MRESDLDDDEEVMLSEISKDAAKVVKGCNTKEEVEKSELGIEEKVDALQQQMTNQRKEKCYLDLEEKMKSKYPEIIRDELLPGETMRIPPQKLVFKKGEEVVPAKITKAIPVALHQVEAAEIEIARLLRTGVIRKVNEVTEWTSPAMFVTKPSGALRIVTDFRQLNKYLERPVHPFLTTEMVTKM